ncbi:hypothetical protein N2M06_11955 [Oceanimonas sp. AH20CE76]|uniref:hypothetical protein n=1 Tax=Oceanimonas sp. AH20CE76 TaxID=2977120 RepID=UPI0031FEB1DB
MPEFKLRFPENEISAWAEKYQFGTDDRPEKVGTFAKENGFLDGRNLYDICEWKSSRKAGSAKENLEASVKELTRFSFSTADEYSRIASLTLLKGVMWPTASVILHFCVSERYPILDVRAIWSLGEDKPSYYTFEYWQEYVRTCQDIADRNKISIRYLDKALWQYSRENQDLIS